MSVDAIQALEQARVNEYGRYVAVAPIDIYGARAFNVGDPVPVSHVENNVVPRDSVRTVDSKSGQAAIHGEG